MISSLDHIILAVDDLQDAEKDYKNILGIEPSWRGLHKELGTANVCLLYTSPSPRDRG